jgi:hypothetical protein|nr:MAG TPA: hypothetical protein [Caudoviricetes sp.]
METNRVYNYESEVRSDVISYGNEWLSYNNETVTENNIDDIRDRLYEAMWTSDSVTGNGSGSYTFNRWIAEENLCHNMDLFLEAAKEFSSDIASLMEEGAEAMDVTIRCYLFSQFLDEFLDEKLNETNE